MEPVDDCADLETQLGGESLYSALGGVGLQLVSSLQGLFLLGSKHHSGLFGLTWVGGVQAGSNV